MTTMTMEASGVSKRYGSVLALDRLDLAIPAGQLTALLGPNGAGKTTLVRLAATLARPDSGTIRVAGHDAARSPHRVRASIGLAGQTAAVEGAMSGRSNLRLVARLYGLSRREAAARADAVIAQLGLQEVAGRLARTYSGGQRRRLDLGASLVGRPRLLLLDEPTTGLDPRSRQELWEAIRALARAGTDVLLTTQYLDEADQLANRVVIVDHGRVIADGSPAELKARAGQARVEARLHRPGDVERAAGALAPLGPPTVDPVLGQVSVAVAGDGLDALERAAAALRAAGVAVDDLGLRRPTLDEVFLALTGAGAGAGAAEFEGSVR